jgi:hypothetical protein
MAGTLTIGTLSDGTNSTSSTNAIMGSAKAWVNFNISGSSCTATASYNVSSITYSSAGVYVVNLTNALTDANFSSAITCTQGGTGYIATCGTRTTTSCQIKTFGQAGSSADATNVSASIFR